MSALITAAVFRRLYYPRPDSNKRQNGCLLIIAGSAKYHGSLLYALKAASRVVGLIYVLSTPDNLNLVKKLKGQTAEFIPVTTLKEALPLVEAILIGPGLGVSARTRRLVGQVLSSGKKVVLDADALNVLDDKLKAKLKVNHILTPHPGEFRRAFQSLPTAANLKSAAQKYHCHIVLKGREDLLADPEGNIQVNQTGNAGMAKGGSGDVLAGLTAAFFCKNPAAVAAQAAVLAVDTAGDDLFKTRKYFYDSEDLVAQLPITLARLSRR
jgi:NAD(P)H-hydrate epimerase